MDTAHLTRRVEALLGRQESVDAPLSGYFLEDGGQDPDALARGMYVDNPFFKQP
ncbi:MAG: hypothetical protein AAF800_05750 [Planctomycetota bacterium]